MTNETREPVYVGIDVSKDSLEVALADKAASVRFINDEQGVKALLEHLAGHNVAVVLLEATGGLEKRCAHALYLAGMTVVVANPRQAHEFAKWVSTAEGSSLWATAFGANPVGKGGPELMDPEVSAFYSGTFNNAALANLWWWPDQSADFLAKRAEYADKYKAA